MKIYHKIIILLATFIFSACDDGWFSRKRWEGRRSSNTIEDSKNREVFVKNLPFKTSDTKYDNKILFFLEEGYRWGYLSYKDTRELKEKEKICQVVGKFNGIKHKDSAFGDTIIASNDYYALNKNLPVNCKFKDTLYFFLIVNKDMYKQDTISKIKVWYKE